MSTPNVSFSPFGENLKRWSTATTDGQRRAMVVGGIAGLLVGSSMGVAAFGSAVNGAVPGAVLGALIGFAVAATEVRF